MRTFAALFIGATMMATVSGCGRSISSDQAKSGGEAPSSSLRTVSPARFRCYNSAQWASDGHERVTASSPAEAVAGFEAAVASDTDFKWEADPVDTAAGESAPANDSAKVVLEPGAERLSIDNSFSGSRFDYSIRWSEQADGYEFIVENTNDSTIQGVRSLRVSFAADPPAGGPLGALALISRSGPLQVVDDPDGAALSAQVGVQHFAVGSRSGEVIAWESPSRPGSGEIVSCLEQ